MPREVSTIAKKFMYDPMEITVGTKMQVIKMFLMNTIKYQEETVTQL
jgi:hypothetical protein